MKLHPPLRLRPAQCDSGVPQAPRPLVVNTKRNQPVAKVEHLKALVDQLETQHAATRATAAWRSS